MAALPANNTDRYFFHYGTAVHNHTMAIRTATGTPETSVITAVAALVFNATSLFAECVGINADIQLAGNTFSTPSSDTGWASMTWGSGTATVEQDSQCLNFQGRTFGGHKARLGIFGYKTTLSDYRLTESESAAIAACVVTLNFSTGVFIGIDGLPPNWYGYGNVKANDYWVRQAR